MQVEVDDGDCTLGTMYTCTEMDEQVLKFARLGCCQITHVGNTRVLAHGGCTDMLEHYQDLCSKQDIPLAAFVPSASGKFFRKDHTSDWEVSLLKSIARP